MVITDQFLTTEHGPTKTALDRCRTLIKQKKNLILVNTAKYGIFYGDCLFYNRVYGNYNEEYIDINEVEWKEVKVPFLQCDNSMPDPKYWIFYWK